MKSLQVVDASSEDAQGNTVFTVVDRFDVSSDGFLVPTPGEDYPDVLTEQDLRRFLVNSSFLSVREAPPALPMEPRGSIDVPPEA